MINTRLYLERLLESCLFTLDFNEDISKRKLLHNFSIRDDLMDIHYNEFINAVMLIPTQQTHDEYKTD